VAEFIGALGQRLHTIKAIRSAFKMGTKNPFSTKQYTFDICSFHKHPDYDNSTFAEWAKSMHCADLSKEDYDHLFIYTVNYFLCPKSEDPLELEALCREVKDFNNVTENITSQKLLLRFGNIVVYLEK